MKVYKGVSASPGLVLGQVSRLEHHVETFSHGPFNPERELRLLANAVHTAQNELDSMAERAAPTEQAIFLFQSMMLEDEGFMNEVAFQIKAGVGAAEAMDRVGRRYAAQLAANAPMRAHGKSDSKEYFAEFFSAWLSGGETLRQLKEAAPQTYAYFEMLSGNGWLAE